MARVDRGLAPCAVLDWKFTVVGNNTVRGGRRGSP
jgi:hypothetical protein